MFGREKDYSLSSAVSSSARKQDLSSGTESFLRDRLTRSEWMGECERVSFSMCVGMGKSLSSSAALTDRAKDVQAVLNLCLPFGLATIGEGEE